MPYEVYFTFLHKYLLWPCYHYLVVILTLEMNFDNMDWPFDSRTSNCCTTYHVGHGDHHFGRCTVSVSLCLKQNLCTEVNC